MKVLIINPGGLPVPAVKGGAVQTLVNSLLDENEKNRDIDLWSVTPYEKEAEKESKKYKNTSFIFFKIPKIITFFDRLIYKIASVFSKHPQSYGRILKTFYYIKCLKRLLLKEEYDKIVFEHNNLLLLVFKDKRIYKKYENKYAIHLHNSIRTIKQVIPFINSCKSIWVVSNFIKCQILGDKRFNVSEDSIKVFYNCINEEEFFQKEPDYKAFGFCNKLAKNKKIILFTGRLNREKGIVELLRAFCRLSHNEYQLLIVGSVFYSRNRNKQSDSIFKQYMPLIETGDIVMTGYVDHSKMAEIYALADVVVLPSMWDEPAGLTMLESVFCSKKTITTRSGGIPEYVNGAAIILDKEDIETKLVKAISEIADFSFDNSKVIKTFNTHNYYRNFCALLKGEFI